ncbi:MAG: bestrophin-like domain [Methylobacter sp.]
MNIFWIYDLPNSLMGCLIVGFFIVLSLLGLLFSRYCFTSLSDEERGPHNDLVSYYLSAIGAIYGITIGLLAAGIWSDYTDVENGVVAEAASLEALYTDLGSLSPAYSRVGLQEALKQHIRFEIEKQWPAHQHGDVLPNTTLMAFQNALLQAEPQSELDEILFAETFSQFNNYMQLRRMRIAHVTMGLPATMWSVVLFGGIMTIGIGWCLQFSSFRLHAAMTVALSGLIGLLVFIIVSMDWPFRGEFNVSPDAIENVLENFQCAAGSDAKCTGTNHEQS